ncbi:LytTR family DNA-binding domain-containing protein [Flammeovirga sp. OC4]|uniref:LytR/AlgR family response regulator transcription factor n=1 Tax=Flammeovirga sp. OC4 TaxID=1382345 RepID=UPI0005C68C3E|nr:LytTR family transcriptional regulator DNA-binding domain-containing protein [Flammeovirga sp. OC4]
MNNQINILIVEDEILLAQDLQLRLESNNDYKTTVVQSYDEAIKVLFTTKMDFLIIDITLKGEKTGIDLANSVNENFNLPFIFLTSHADQQTFDQAKLAKPHAYLLKPFNDRMISMSIDLAISNFNSALMEEDTEAEEQTSPTNKNSPDSLFIKHDNKFKKVAISDIIYLEADSNYTIIHTQEMDYTYAIVLKKIQEKINHPNFLRIHRSYIINTNYVTAFENNAVTLNEDHQLPVSRQHKDEMYRRFQMI